MAKIFTVVKMVRRVSQQAISSAANFVVSAKSAIKTSVVADLVVAIIKPAIVVQRIVASLMSRQVPAVAVLRTFFSGVARVFQRPALLVQNKSSGTPAKPASNPAFDIQRTIISLVANRSAASVTEEAVGGRTDWANDANATGPVNGTTATIAGNALGARGGRLVLSYPASLNKAALTISKVELRFYVTQSGTTLNNGTLKLGYRLGTSADVTLQTVASDISSLSQPQVFDIMGVIAGDWAKLDTLKSVVEFNTQALNTSSAAVDAVIVYVEASRTEVH